MSYTLIEHPEDEALDVLCAQLAALSPALDKTGAWPQEQLELLGQAGVYAWFIPEVYGGLGWSPAQIAQGYLRLGSACITTAFILTQRVAACRRIATADNEALRAELLPRLLSSSTFATVGLSHLTTSRQHLARPAVLAVATESGYFFDGVCPWVTGGNQADCIVAGAMLEDGRKILAVIPGEASGVEPGVPASLVALGASQTGAVGLKRVYVPSAQILGVPDVGARTPQGGGSGGLQTSTLALALARAAVQYLEQQMETRPDLHPVWAGFDGEFRGLWSQLLAISRGEQGDVKALRAGANHFVMRATQAALIVAKGAGFLGSHPVGRWCREALFFLVWSNPAAVQKATLEALWDTGATQCVES